MSSITDLRTSISTCDERIIALIAQRMKIAQEIGQLKKEKGLPVHDPAREAELAALHARIARATGVSEQCIRDVFGLIISESKRVQETGKSV